MFVYIVLKFRRYIPYFIKIVIYLLKSYQDKFLEFLF